MNQQKIVLLRKNMKELKIDAFLVPHNDMYFNEITAPYYNRLEWVTGFTGSAGFAIIFEKSAVIFTDGRYSIQIQKEVSRSFSKIENITKISPFSWLNENIQKKNKIAKKKFLFLIINSVFFFKVINLLFKVKFI